MLKPLSFLILLMFLGCEQKAQRVDHSDKQEKAPLKKPQQQGYIETH